MRMSHSFEARPEQKTFWGQITPLIAEVGANPVLVLSQAEGQAMRRVMRTAPADRAELRIEKRRRTQIGGSYIGTIEGTDVFSAGFAAGTAWLFSANALRSIRYAEVERPTRYVVVVFDPGEQVIGTLRVRVHQKFEWSDAPIFEIKFLDKPEHK
jgi:hypothetical protein